MAGIPSYALVLKPGEVPSQLSECWDVGNLVDPKLQSGEAWETSFENEWHAPLLEAILRQQPFPSLHYLLREVGLVEVSNVSACVSEFDGLIQGLVVQPEVICEYDLGQSISTPQVVSAIKTASASRTVNDDDYPTMLAAFCAFLASQRAALRQASESGCALLYVQFKA